MMNGMQTLLLLALCLPCSACKQLRIHEKDIASTSLALPQQTAFPSFSPWRLVDHSAGKPFLFIYDLPGNLSEHWNIGSFSAGLPNWSDQYGIDLMLYKRMKSDIAVRTTDPSAAQLFFIPVFPTRLLNRLFVEDYSNVWRQPVPNEQGKLPHSLTLTANLVQDALKVVQSQVYWSRCNGCDHFIILPHDFGRCSHNVFPTTAGRLFSLQYLGDLTAYFRGSACFEPEWDVLLPTMHPLPWREVVKPFATARNISLLYSFEDKGAALANYFGRQLRVELLRMHRLTPFPGSKWTMEDRAQSSKWPTIMLMTHSVFCLAPPGYSAWTQRFYDAIISGCIPVTFYRANKLPWTKFGMDYSKFTVNIQPEQAGTLFNVLSNLQSQPHKIDQMQRDLSLVQEMFLWSRSGTAYASLITEMRSLDPRRLDEAT
jgi:hypothetical protein